MDGAARTGGETVITVVMTTYAPAGEGKAREQYAQRTLQALLTNLRAPEPIKLHVADDGSNDQWYISTLCEIASSIWNTESSTTNSGRRGIGASLNKALSRIDGPWLYITDDWLLTATLDLSVPCRLLADQQYDLVRIGPPHPNLRCFTRFCEGLGWWLDIDASWGGFAFATRPFLAGKDFYRLCGPFLEGGNAYVVEQDYAVRVAELKRAHIAYYDASFNRGGPWQHIGEYEVGEITP